MATVDRRSATRGVNTSAETSEVDVGGVHPCHGAAAVVPEASDAWDGWVLECCDIFKDDDTYYWYYHARGDRKHYPKLYRVGVATAPSPLGPWTSYEGNPIRGLISARLGSMCLN